MQHDWVWLCRRCGQQREDYDSEDGWSARPPAHRCTGAKTPTTNALAPDGPGPEAMRARTRGKALRRRPGFAGPLAHELEGMCP